MTLDNYNGDSKSDGACGTGINKDNLYVYLYGTDVDVFPCV